LLCFALRRTPAQVIVLKQEYSPPESVGLKLAVIIQSKLPRDGKYRFSDSSVPRFLTVS
jgi:hypothetical protein